MATVKFRLRRDTAANWTVANPVLGLGEPGLEIDTRKVKYGDGSTAWTSLSYSAAGAIAWADITGKPTTLSGYGLTVNDGDWSGADLAVANGGTGASTAASARTNLGAQAQSAKLDSAAALSGAIVGTSDTQTLSAKTFSGATLFPSNTSITSGGRILGKSAAGNYHTLAESNSGDYAVQVKNESSSDGFGLLITSAATQANSFTLIDAYTSGTGSLRFRVQGSGNVQNANNSYGATSDRRLKKWVRPAGNQWRDVLGIELVSFVRRRDPEKRRQLGVIAQQVEQVSPGLVTEDGDGMKAVAYSVLLLKGFGALQEAMRRIEALESLVAELRAGAEHDAPETRRYGVSNHSKQRQGSLTAVIDAESAR